MPSLYAARQSHPKKRRWHVVQSLFFIFVFSLAVFVFLQSSFFRVKAIKVNGNKQFTKAEVVALTGLQQGLNIFKANLKQAEEKAVLHPMVRQVEIIRDLPDTIIINLTERKAIGLVAQNGNFIVMSEDGCYLSKVNNLSNINLPIITGIDLGQAGPGQKVADGKLKTALDYLMTMPENIRAAVSEINVSDLNNIRMFTIDKAEVRFGDAKRIGDKIKLYQEVINQKYQNRIQYMDISYRGSPVVKFIEPKKQDKPQQ
ncbi:MAG: FtsQ-type POTRA domain-containing protein [Eubacteriales bacterium]